MVAELAFIATEFVPEAELALVANDCCPVAYPFIKAIAPWPVSAIEPCPIATLSVDFAVPCIETELDPEAVPSKDIELLPEAVPVKAIELDPDAVPETKAILFTPEANVPFTP